MEVRPVGEEEKEKPQEESGVRESQSKKSGGAVCYICGKTALRSCEHCHNKICTSHYDPSTGLCTQCKSKGGSGGIQCYVCSNPAGHRCRSCGQNVCGNHYDPNQGLCTMCKIREHREAVRFGGSEED